jgi:P27 family predicted phage terminase small subunit
MPQYQAFTGITIMRERIRKMLQAKGLCSSGESEADMRGRPPKPLRVKLAEGSDIRRDRVNADAPEPPRGPLDPPPDLAEDEAVVWVYLVASQAPGVFRPLDAYAMRQYCWSYAHLLAAQQELRAWAQAPKKPGETAFLRRARNGALVKHQLFDVIKDLKAQVAASEISLGLTPVARERIHAGVQGDLFPGSDDPWEAFDVREKKAN